MFLKSKFNPLHPIISQIKNFTYVLVIVFLCTYFIYAFLFYFFKNIMVAYFASFVSGLLLNLYMKPNFVFLTEQKLGASLRYSVYYLLYSISCYKIIMYLTSTLGISAYYAIIISSVTMLPVHFLASKFIFK